MAFDSKGRLVFADSWDNDGGSWHHIRRIDTDGTIRTNNAAIIGRRYAGPFYSLVSMQDFATRARLPAQAAPMGYDEDRRASGSTGIA